MCVALSILSSQSLRWLGWQLLLAVIIASAPCLELVHSVHAQSVIYVNPAASAPGSGLSWSTAYTNVQDSLAPATISASLGASVQVWATQGVYYPDVGQARIDDALTSTFPLTDDVARFDGLVANESCALSLSANDAETVDAITVSATHIFARPGQYDVTITASNTAGTVQASLPVTIDEWCVFLPSVSG